MIVLFYKNYMYDIMNMGCDSMIINGANIGEKSVEYKKLSNHKWTDDKELMELIKKLELLYLGIEDKSKVETINSMDVDSNGNVIIPEHALNHRCSNSLESLSEIAKHGLLAAEWFGELESEREGCFCTFLSRMKGDSYPYKGDLAEDDNSRLNIGKNVILFFDENNSLMQYLLHLDYFEFEHKKQTDPNYTSSYTKEELEILEELIEPISPAGKNMRKSHDFKTNYWSAIPGGIPSMLINGICVKNNNYTEEELDEISNMYPNATVFDSNKKVLRYPLMSESNDFIDEKTI